MLVLRKYGDDPTVTAVGRARGSINSGLRDRLDRLPLRLHRKRGDGWWTVGWLPFDIMRSIDRMRPDIVQFHWAGRGVAPIGMLQRLTRRGYPVVWTLRDMWPLTGGCHYSNGCEKFLTQCGACHQLGTQSPYDLSTWQWRRKHRAWRNAEVTYVAMSNWMADYAKRSPLTFENEVAIIPNGIDTARFSPVDKDFARSVWGIPKNKRVILFGALNATTDRRKGFEFLRDALSKLSADGWRDDTVFVMFGGESEGENVGLPTHHVGRVHDEVSLSLLYSCADVMVVPSVQENFGKTAIEAMACGVPVVAFANTGQLDIIDHRVNGYLAENLSTEDLANGIAWCLTHGGAGEGLSRNARGKALRKFDMRRIARSHVDLYQRLLSRRACLDGAATLAGAEETDPDTLTTRSMEAS